MPHAVSHRPIVHARRYELRRVEMPQVMDTEAWQFKPSESGEVVSNIGRVKRDRPSWVK